MQELLGTGARFRPSQDARPLRVFFDTEFTVFRDGELLAIGMVAEDGSEFYVELADAALHACSSEFVKQHVLPQFGRVDGATVAQRATLARRVSDFLLALPPPIEVCYDYGLDRRLLTQALHDSGQWVAHFERTTECNVVEGPLSEEARAAAEASFQRSRVEGLEQHHALADARALHAAYAARPAER
ncbi:MAG: hypothetical protein EOP39_00135 [Rubrivivax sp.]|nr:MAG: hypothetical protein EOP39_00135 [Rubrivivax sp.]